MSNDAVPPVEISLASKEVNDWVVIKDIEALLNNSTIEMSPKEKETKKIPSIYGNWKCSKDILPETMKWQFAAYMKRWFDLDVCTFFEKIHKEEDNLWRHYDGVDEQFFAENRKRFIENLLANSCFLIFAMIILNADNYRKLYDFLYRCEDDANNQRIHETRYLESFILHKQMEIQRYMLTMENQIPLLVVDAVYKEHSNLSKELNTPIHELAISCFKGIYPGEHESKLHITDRPEFQHLLHIFHWSRTPKEKFHTIHEWFPRKMDNFYIPSATDLQLSRTVFEKHAASGIDVHFYKAIISDVMQLPNKFHFQYKDEFYKKLLAFEKGYGTVCGLSVAAHIACILCLVKTEEDVKLLRAKHIIPRIEDNKDVLKSLESYKTTVLSDTIDMSVDLSELMKAVMSHHEKNTCIKKCYADFKRRYCSVSWITISVVGGILLFVLTCIQTIYSVLSYYKQ